MDSTVHSTSDLEGTHLTTAARDWDSDATMSDDSDSTLSLEDAEASEAEDSEATDSENATDRKMR
jgi:hypothetical protein